MFGRSHGPEEGRALLLARTDDGLDGRGPRFPWVVVPRWSPFEDPRNLRAVPHDQSCPHIIVSIFAKQILEEKRIALRNDVANSRVYRGDVLLVPGAPKRRPLPQSRHASIPQLPYVRPVVSNCMHRVGDQRMRRG